MSGFGSFLRDSAANPSCFPIIEGAPSVHTLTKLLKFGFILQNFSLNKFKTSIPRILSLGVPKPAAPHSIENRKL